jgi:hypothetical protein
VLLLLKLACQLRLPLINDILDRLRGITFKMVSLANFFNKLNSSTAVASSSRTDRPPKPRRQQGSTTSRDSNDDNSNNNNSDDDFSDDDTLCAVPPPADDDPLAEWRRARWQPGDKEMHARLLKRLDKMQKQALNQRGVSAIEAARDYFASDSLVLPETPSERARETLAACVADAFCMWSCDRADIENSRGVQDWQLEYYGMFRRPSRLFGSPVVPVRGNGQVKLPFSPVSPRHN